MAALPQRRDGLQRVRSLLSAPLPPPARVDAARQHPSAQAPTQGLIISRRRQTWVQPATGRVTKPGDRDGRWSLLAVLVLFDPRRYEVAPGRLWIPPDGAFPRRCERLFARLLPGRDGWNGCAVKFEFGFEFVQEWRRKIYDSGPRHCGWAIEGMLRRQRGEVFVAEGEICLWPCSFLLSPCLPASSPPSLIKTIDLRKGYLLLHFYICVFWMMNVYFGIGWPPRYVFFFFLYR